MRAAVKDVQGQILFTGYRDTPDPGSFRMRIMYAVRWGAPTFSRLRCSGTLTPEGLPGQVEGGPSAICLDKPDGAASGIVNVCLHRLHALPLAPKAMASVWRGR